ncbi:Adenylate and Guanylate cyclase catalytic domain containing protein [Tritrichomonas foetus]|uniref:Adenylate and Guanylate cyclase catalytic domain containing protein n=1 Tax=Tritrichomonas foetus TaxID=1144522 RepID=A0A1J4KLR2_9EUKA|nr:Adenylate and Guanylate cyclase catalytic domain containing protein [Tritrichomonas foetus]|eukprot:OHT12241.1 Adenylate and Guanylate cyclase catalytic domain containing protein [Tritrichomonas foetus]
MTVVSQSLSTISVQSSTSLSEQFSSGEKYGGMLKRSLSSTIRNRLYLMMNYFDNTVPTFYGLHEVVTFWRAIQMIGPSFMAASELIWKQNSVATDGLAVISIFYHLVPPKFRNVLSIIVQFLCVALLAIFFISLFGASFYFNKNAKLPPGSAITFTIFMNTFLYLLPPITVNFAGEMFSHLLMNNATTYSLPLEILAIILSIIISAISVFFVLRIMALSVTFRPTSFLTTLCVPQTMIFGFTVGISFITGIAAHLAKIPQLILLIVAAIIYGCSLITLFLPGTCVKLFHRNLFFMCGLSGCINLITLAIYLILDKQADQPQFFFFIAILVISYFIGLGVLRSVDRKRIELLNKLMEDSGNSEYIKSVNHLISLMCTGLEYAHPQCSSWSLFDVGTDRWETNPVLWCAYAKFVAIYPEESNILGYVLRGLINHRFKGPLAKETMGHSSLIQMQRENTLSTNLKRKISGIQKSITITKRKLRSIWDLVIQGNVNDLESSISTAFNAQNNVSNDFTHLITQYPNNRFVARTYARFIKEIEGDQKLYIAWLDKVHVLQRGLSVNEDITSTMGLHAFPLLSPHSLNAKIINPSNATQSLMESESLISVENDIDEDNSQQVEQYSVLRQRIHDVRIPAISFLRISSILLLIIFIIVPAIAIFIYAPVYINSNSTPLEFMSNLALLRSYNFQLPLWAHHWIMEELPFESNNNQPMFSKPDFKHTPTTLGSTNETHGQLKFLLHEFCAALENLGNFRSFETDNPDLELVHKVVFSADSIKYDYYTSINTSIPKRGNILSIYLDTLLELSSLSDEEPSFDGISSYKLLNPYLNANNMATNISDSLISLTNYINNQALTMNKIVQLVEIVACLLFGVIWIGIGSYQLVKLHKNKMIIYRCLTSLPKNVVSTVSESLRVLKKDENTRSTEIDTEINKQEENLLKLFASAGDSGGSSSSIENIIFILLNTINLAICIINIVLLCSIFPKVTTTMTRNAPHLDDVMGTTAYMVGIFLALNNAVVANTNGYDHHLDINLGIGGRPILSSLQRVSNRLETYLDYYHKARYGWPETNEPPFEKYNQQLEEAAKILTCPNLSEVFSDYSSVTTCFSVDVQILLFEPFVQNFIQPVVSQMPGGRIRTTDDVFVQLWMLQCNLYDTLFFPMFDGIVPTMTSMMSSVLPSVQIPVVILIVLSIIIELIMLYFIDLSEQKMKYALNLLSLCNINAVLQASHINDVLLGDFSDKMHETALRDSSFFESLVENIPMAILVANPQSQIIIANQNLKQIFKKDEITGDIHDFFSPETFSKLFSDKDGGEAVETINNMNLKFKSCQVSQHFVVFVSDDTETAVLLRKIKEEKARVEFILGSLIPIKMVNSQGHSYAVQTCSVTFVNIVSFTNYAHEKLSDDPSKVIATLTQFFTKLEQLVNMKTQLTKVKTYGDCMMVAGGLFAEMNIAAEHTKESVEFALEALEVAKELDINVRIGLSTKGIVVAGIVYAERPTFEIFGDTIALARQLEETSPVNAVHISRMVYELIYGGQFQIKERGQTKLCGFDEPMETYIVEKKK